MACFLFQSELNVGTLSTMEAEINEGELQEVSLNDLERLLIKLEQPEEDDFMQHQLTGDPCNPSTDIMQLLTDIKQEPPDMNVLPSGGIFTNHTSLPRNGVDGYFNGVTNSYTTHSTDLVTLNFPYGAASTSSWLTPTFNLPNLNANSTETSMPTSSGFAEAPIDTTCSDALMWLASSLEGQRQQLKETSDNMRTAVLPPAVAGPSGIQLTEPQTLRSPGDKVVGTFQLDTTQLTNVPVNQQAKELQDLGLTVYNQDDLEQDIMAQVDQAMADQEQKRLKTILEKDLKSVTDDIR